ncbi:MAG: type II toxin-antitoxin system Phd/YefM family antitoxin [bacterium]
MKINVKEARSKLSSLLDRVEEGEEVIITRHGKEVARLIRSNDNIKKLPSLKKFRSSIQIKTSPLSDTVIKARKKERY